MEHQNASDKQPSPAVGAEGAGFDMGASGVSSSRLGALLGSPNDNLKPSDIVALQRSHGNQFVQRLVARQQNKSSSVNTPFSSLKMVHADQTIQRQEAPRRIEAVDIRPLSEILTEMESDGASLLNMMARAFNHDGVQFEDVRPFIERATYSAREGVREARDVMNSARLHFPEREFQRLSRLLYDTNAPGAPTGMPRRVEIDRPFSEVIVELRADPDTMLRDIIGSAVRYNGTWRDIQQDVTAASTSEREIVLRNTDLIQDVREHWSDADVQALLTALRQSPSATSPEVTAGLERLRAEHLSLPQFLRAAFALGARVHDVRADIDAASPRARATVSDDESYMESVSGQLPADDYQQLLIALRVGLVSGGGRGTSRTPEETDAGVRRVLGRYLQDAVQAGAQIEDHVAIVGDADWERVGRAEFGDEWDENRTRIAGFYSTEDNRVWIHRGAGGSSTIIHEAIHLYSNHGALSEFLNEGITEYFTQYVCEQLNIVAFGTYDINVSVVRRIIRGLDRAGFDGRDVIAQAYFNGQFNHLVGAFERSFGTHSWTRFSAAVGDDRRRLANTRVVNEIIGR